MLPGTYLPKLCRYLVLIHHQLCYSAHCVVTLGQSRQCHSRSGAQPGFHFRGVRALGAGPQVLRASRFSLSAASVGPRYLLHVHETYMVIRLPGVWLLIEPEATLYNFKSYVYVDIILRLQVQRQCLFLQPHFFFINLVRMF